MQTEEIFDIEELAEEVEQLVDNKQFDKLKKTLIEMESVDIALLISELPNKIIPIVFRILPKELAADTLVEMDSDEQQILLEAFNDSELAVMMNELFVDDTVDIIEEMPANFVKRMLKYVPAEKRKAINEIMHYPEDSAGSIMTIEYIDFVKTMTVEDACNKIRAIGLKKETIYTCYVRDENRHLIGLVTALDLMTSDKNALISEIMDDNVISVETITDKEEVGNVIKKYDLLAVPVVDKENRLVGIVTVDDAIDVIAEEAEEDFAKMAAITPMEHPYLKTSVFEIWGSRIIWLLLLMVSATFTGMIISSFEAQLSAMVVLTAFIPMLMDSGGNSGSQASVTIIRGISTGEIEFNDILKVIWKEFRVSLLCGLSMAAITFGKILLFDGLIMNNDQITPLVAFAVSLTLFITIVIAKFIGCTLPLLAKKLKLDPAVMASPFITTIVDAVSLLIYLNIAKAMLNL